MPFFVKATVVLYVLCAANLLNAQTQAPAQFARQSNNVQVESPGEMPSPAAAAPAAPSSRALPPRSENLRTMRSADQADRGKTGRLKGPASSVTTALGALAIVLGLFFLFAWLVKRAAPKGSAVLPGEVVEVLGRAPLAARQNVHLVRIGNKLLLVSVSAAGAETLTEITDSVEVDRLVGICTQSKASSTTAAFRQIFHQFSREPTSPGFIDEDRTSKAGAAGSRLSMEAPDV